MCISVIHEVYYLWVFLGCGMRDLIFLRRVILEIQAYWNFAQNKFSPTWYVLYRITRASAATLRKLACKQCTFLLELLEYYYSFSFFHLVKYYSFIVVVLNLLSVYYSKIFRVIFRDLYQVGLNIWKYSPRPRMFTLSRVELNTKRSSNC